MAATKKKDPRGGKRAGAGRPAREPLSVRQVKEMLKKAEVFAKEHGKTIDEILLEFIYGVTTIKLGVDAGDGSEVTLEEIKNQKVGVRDRIACIKLFKDYTSPKITEGSEGDRQIGPAVYLPEQYGKVLELVGRKEEPEEEPEEEK